MELINKTTRKAIKQMVYISQCTRALTLIPTPEDFAIRLIGDMRIIARRVNSISVRINEILDRYSAIPSEFLFESFKEILKHLNNIGGYTDSAIVNLMSSKKTYRYLGNINDITSANLQVGGGLTYDPSLGSNINLICTEDGFRHMSSYDTTDLSPTYGNLGNIHDINYPNGLESTIDIKRELETNIMMVKTTFDCLTKDFDEMFGFLNGSSFEENNYKPTDYNELGESLSDAAGEIKAEVDRFVKNFNIGKVVSAIGGLVVGAGAATLAMDMLPAIDTDRILKDVVGGVDRHHIDRVIEMHNLKTYGSDTNLLNIPDSNRKMNRDDLEIYNSNGYDKYISDFEEENDRTRSEVLKKMQNAKTRSDITAVATENGENNQGNKSALKSIRNIRRTAIRAKQIENYKRFLSIELDSLKKECLYMKITIKNEWDLMMNQYKTSINEITRFFTVDGCGGNETVDRCCDRINDDANQIVELCKSIAVEITNASCMVGVPYAVGFCCDMPVHKVLAFIKDIQIILTFLKNLIRLALDIIVQLSILAKLIFCGIQSLAEILMRLKNLIGVNKVLDMVDDMVGKIKPQMIDGKLLVENALSPIYYNETEDYERRIEVIEGLLSDEENGGYVEQFRYTDDVNARSKYRNKVYGGYVSEDDIEDILEELEEKGEREIVAYRSPLLTANGDDFAGWVFYYANAYDDMKHSWSSRKKRKRNRVIRKASKKNKLRGGRLSGGVADLKRNKSFGYYNESGAYVGNSVTGFDAYYWYTKYTNDPTDCDPDFDNTEFIYDDDGNIIGKNDNFKQSVVTPIQTTANGSLVELNDGRRVFVEGKIVKSGDYVNVNGVKYKVK